MRRQTLPLCCRYLVVVVDVLPLTVTEAGVVRDQIVYWALGMLADGEREVLGAWPRPASGRTGLHQLFEDLKVRGVEKIRFVASNERMDLSAALRVAYPDATVLPSIGQLLRQSLTQAVPRRRGSGADALDALCATATAHAARAALLAMAASPWGESNPTIVERWRIAVAELDPFFALVPRLRRLVRSGDEATQRVTETLQRAVGRNGCFPSETAAISFSLEVLGRANRALAAAGRRTNRGARSQVRGQREASALAGCH